MSRRSVLAVSALICLAATTEILAGSTCVATPPDAIAWYAAESNSLDAHASHDGQIIGAAFGTGQVGQAFEFDGTGPHILVPDDAGLRPSSAFTAEAWVFVPTAGAQAMLVTKSHSSTWASWRVNLTAGQLEGSVQDQSNLMWPEWTSVSTLPTNQWVHVAFTWDGANLDSTDGQVYVDGVAVAQTYTPNSYGSGFSIQYDSEPVEIGRSSYGGTPGNFFNGLIDELTLYDRALSATEIQAISAAGTAGKCRCGDGVVTAPEECDDANTINNDGCRNDCTIWVGPTPILVPEDQLTIGDCIQVAIAGDTCSVKPGLYEPGISAVVDSVNAHYVLDKGIRVVSRVPYQAILDGGSQGGAMFVVREAEDAHIEGFVIRNTGFGVIQRLLMGEVGTRWTAQNLLIDNSSFGIGIDGTARIGDGELWNITVRNTSTCFYTNDAGDLQVHNAVAQNCDVAFEGFNHDDFTVDYSTISQTDIDRRFVSSSDFLPTFGTGVIADDAHLVDLTTSTYALPGFPSCAGAAIDSGNPGPAFDDALSPTLWGGTRNDGGSYGGPANTLSLGSSEVDEIFDQLTRFSIGPGGEEMWWCSPSGATEFDVVMGDLGVLRSTGGDFTQAVTQCAAEDQTGTTLTLIPTPPTGNGYWFLVRCPGCAGPYADYDSLFPSQIGSRDAEIAAAVGACN